MPVVICIERGDEMTVDRDARTNLQSAIVAYMSGAIRTFAFEDRYSSCRASTDESVQAIAKQVWYLHDDLVDHPISVRSEGWEALRRTVAFVGTDMNIATSSKCDFWPFHDESQWRHYEHLVNELGLPAYDQAVHGRPTNTWWNRIPTVVGASIVVGILSAVLLVLAFL